MFYMTSKRFWCIWFVFDDSCRMKANVQLDDNNDEMLLLFYPYTLTKKRNRFVVFSMTVFRSANEQSERLTV